MSHTVYRLWILLLIAECQRIKRYEIARKSALLRVFRLPSEAGKRGRCMLGIQPGQWGIKQIRKGVSTKGGFLNLRHWKDEAVRNNMMSEDLSGIGPLGESVRLCPTCESKYDAALSSALPFCSERCQQIDLGRWFNEENSVPHVPTEEELDRMIEEVE